MRTFSILPALSAAVLLISTSTTVLGQTAAPATDPHHPAVPGAPPTTDVSPASPPAANPPSMGGMMGMMPSMMGMMPSMMGMMGGSGGQQGMMPCPMMPMGMGAGPGMGMGAGMGMGPGMGMTPGMGMEPHGSAMLYGMPRHAEAEMTPARVRAWLEDHLARLDNPRLRIGEIVEIGDSTVTAEIETIDGSLVQKLAFNRFPGLVRQVNE